MKIKRPAATAAALILVGAGPAEPPAKITSIEARLFDPEKGEFTGNILKDGLYVGWNTFMMEGNGGYGLGDAMVVVKVAVTKPDGGYATIQSPLTISARSKGKLIAQRHFTRIQTNSGEVARALYLQNVGCAGDIYVKAELQGQSKTVRLAMECGE